MYAETFETDDGWEVIKWACEDDSIDDDGTKAVARYRACDHCIKVALDCLDIAAARHEAHWIDEAGTVSDDTSLVCDECLAAGDECGPGYRAAGRVAIGGRCVDLSATVALMDDELRELAHGELAPCEPQEFVDRYCELHRARHGADFVVN